MCKFFQETLNMISLALGRNVEDEEIEGSALNCSFRWSTHISLGVVKAKVDQLW